MHRTLMCGTGSEPPLQVKPVPTAQSTKRGRQRDEAVKQAISSLGKVSSCFDLRRRDRWRFSDVSNDYTPVDVNAAKNGRPRPDNSMD